MVVLSGVVPFSVVAVGLVPLVEVFVVTLIPSVNLLVVAVGLVPPVGVFVAPEGLVPPVAELTSVVLVLSDDVWLTAPYVNALEVADVRGMFWNVAEGEVGGGVVETVDGFSDVEEDPENYKYYI